jgi:CTP synthase (UTP-ammonia lyase)
MTVRQREDVAVVGDFDPGNHTHLATNAALEHVGASFRWVPTEACEGAASERLAGYGGVFIAPASPYRSMEGALEAIRHARERGVPLVGT